VIYMGLGLHFDARLIEKETNDYKINKQITLENLTSYTI